jgi:DNA polymerase-4
VTIGDVQSRSEAWLARTLGEHLGAHLFVLANGLDLREVEPDRAARSIGHELTFAEDVHDTQIASDILLQLAEGVGRRLRRDRARGTVVRLKLRYPDFTTLVRQRKVPPTADDLELHRVARELLLANWDRARGIRLLGVTAAQLVADAGPAQGALFEEAARKRGALLEAMDAIRDRHGEGSVRHATERRATNSWGPEPSA